VIVSVPKASNLTAPLPLINVSQSLKKVKFFAQVFNAQAGQEPVLFRWTVRLSNGTVIPQSDHRKQNFAVTPAKMPASTQKIKISVQVVQRANSSRNSSTASFSVALEILERPLIASASVSPMSGVAFNTSFSVACRLERSLRVQYEISSTHLVPGSKLPLKTTEMKAGSSEDVSVGSLSAGNWTLFVRAFDGKGWSPYIALDTVVVFPAHGGQGNLNPPTPAGDASAGCGQQDVCCQLNITFVRVLNQTTGFSEKVFAMVGFLISHTSKLSNCLDLHETLWARAFATVSTSLGQPCSQLAQALFILHSRALPAVASRLEAVQQLLDIANRCYSVSTLACSQLQQSLNLALGLPALDCNSTEVLLKTFTFVSCQCAGSLFPGEVESIANTSAAEGTGEGATSVISKCLVDPAFACSSLPADLQLDPAVLAQLADSVSTDKTGIQAATISFVTHKALQRCRFQLDVTDGSAVGSNVTSISILNNCTEVEVSNLTKTISFLLPLNNQPTPCGQQWQDQGQVIDQTSCRFWKPSSGTWEYDGCRATAVGDRVRCDCSHLTDFAIFFRLKNCLNSRQFFQVSYIAAALFLALLLLCLADLAVVLRLLRIRGVTRLKGINRDTATVCAKQFSSLCLAATVQIVLIMGSREDRAVISVVSTVGQMTLLYTFAMVLLTWAHLHHFGVQGVQQDLMRKQVTGLCVAGGLINICGFVTIEVTQDRQKALALTKGFAAVNSVLSVGLAVGFLYFGHMMANAMRKVEKSKGNMAKTSQTSGNNNTKKKSQRGKNAKFTSRLTKALCVLFVVQSLVTMLTSFYTGSSIFDDLVALSELATLSLFFALYLVYHPKVKRLYKAASKDQNPGSHRLSLRSMRCSATNMQPSATDMRSSATDLRASSNFTSAKYKSHLSTLSECTLKEQSKLDRSISSSQPDTPRTSDLAPSSVELQAIQEL